jgi:hypothetical protein
MGKKSLDSSGPNNALLSSSFSLAKALLERLERQGGLFLFGWLRRRNLALEQLYLDLGVLPDNMVRSPSALHAKPFLKVGIPADVQMFHIVFLSNALLRLRQAPLSLFGDRECLCWPTLCFPIAFFSAG